MKLILVSQRVELDARAMLMSEIFQNQEVLAKILHDNSVGVLFLTKTLTAGCVTPEERIQVATLIRKVMSASMKVVGESVALKKLVEEVNLVLPKAQYPQSQLPMRQNQSM